MLLLRIALIFFFGVEVFRFVDDLIFFFFALSIIMKSDIINITFNLY